jgi:hypothetical protein
MEKGGEGEWIEGWEEGRKGRKGGQKKERLRLTHSAQFLKPQ